jgi:DNA-directed RNA polymerase specialized sigma24 family protein
LKHEEKNLNSKEITFGEYLDKLPYQTLWEPEIPEDQKLPKLTGSEIQLIKYRKMGLSSIEIAKLMNMTVESVYKKLYKIRRKGKK